MPDDPTHRPPTPNWPPSAAKLDATEQELNNYKLLLADFENARKRTAPGRGSRAEVRHRAAGPRPARGAGQPRPGARRRRRQAGDNGPLAAGVSATASQLLDVLKRHGVTRIECGPGTPFDPNLHQAVMQQPSNDFAPGPGRAGAPAGLHAPRPRAAAGDGGRRPSDRPVSGVRVTTFQVGGPGGLDLELEPANLECSYADLRLPVQRLRAHFDELQSFSEPPLTKCPECKKNKLERLFGGGGAIIFKGNGFYETDYRRGRGEGQGQAEGRGQDRAEARRRPRRRRHRPTHAGEERRRPSQGRSRRAGGAKKKGGTVVGCRGISEVRGGANR